MATFDISKIVPESQKQSIATQSTPVYGPVQQTTKTSTYGPVQQVSTPVYGPVQQTTVSKKVSTPVFGDIQEQVKQSIADDIAKKSQTFKLPTLDVSKISGKTDSQVFDYGQQQIQQSISEEAKRKAQEQVQEQARLKAQELVKQKVQEQLKTTPVFDYGQLKESTKETFIGPVQREQVKYKPTTIDYSKIEITKPITSPEQQTQQLLSQFEKRGDLSLTDTNILLETFKGLKEQPQYGESRITQLPEGVGTTYSLEETELREQIKPYIEKNLGISGSPTIGIKGKDYADIYIDIFETSDNADEAKKELKTYIDRQKYYETHSPEESLNYLNQKAVMKQGKLKTDESSIIVMANEANELKSIAEDKLLKQQNSIINQQTKDTKTVRDKYYTEKYLEEFKPAREVFQNKNVLNKYKKIYEENTGSNYDEKYKDVNQDMGLTELSYLYLNDKLNNKIEEYKNKGDIENQNKYIDIFNKLQTDFDNDSKNLTYTEEEFKKITDTNKDLQGLYDQFNVTKNNIKNIDLIRQTQESLQTDIEKAGYEHPLKRIGTKWVKTIGSIVPSGVTGVAGIEDKPSIVDGIFSKSEKESIIKQENIKTNISKVSDLVKATGIVGLAVATGGVSAGVGALTGTLLTTPTVEAFKQAEYYISPQEQKSFLKDYKGFSEAMRSGWESETIKKSEGWGGNLGWLRSTLADMPLAEYIPGVGAKDAFETGIREYYRQKGVTGDELELAVKTAKDQRAAGIIGEDFAVLIGNVGAELVGRRAISKGLLSGLKEKSFVTGFKKIAPAGIVEGAIVETARQEKEFAKGDPSNVINAMVQGYVTAGLVGGILSKTAGTKLGKKIEFAGNISDLFEPVGDKTADFLERVSPTVAKYTFKQKPKVFTVTSVDMAGKAMNKDINLQNIPAIRTTKGGDFVVTQLTKSGDRETILVPGNSKNAKILQDVDTEMSDYYDYLQSLQKTTKPKTVIETVVKPETKIKEKTKVKEVVKPEILTDAKAILRTDVYTQVQPTTKTDISSKLQEYIQSKAVTETKPEIVTEVKPLTEVETVVKPVTETEVQPETETKITTETQTQPLAETLTQVGTQVMTPQRMFPFYMPSGGLYPSGRRGGTGRSGREYTVTNKILDIAGRWKAKKFGSPASNVQMFGVKSQKSIMPTGILPTGVQRTNVQRTNVQRTNVPQINNKTPTMKTNGNNKLNTKLGTKNINIRNKIGGMLKR